MSDHLLACRFCGNMLASYSSNPSMISSNINKYHTISTRLSVNDMVLGDYRQKHHLYVPCDPERLSTLMILALRALPLEGNLHYFQRMQSSYWKHTISIKFILATGKGSDPWPQNCHHRSLDHPTQLSIRLPEWRQMHHLWPEPAAHSWAGPGRKNCHHRHVDHPT